MGRADGEQARKAAERRVREKQAEQMRKLLEWQDGERRREFGIQKRALDEIAQRETALTEEHRRASERLEREWQQQRDRLGHAPGPAPSFGFPPPQRDLNDEYKRAREQHQRRRAELEKQFERGIAACGSERASQLEAFRNANQARERDFEEQRTTKAEEQERGFETLVHRQMRLAERSLGEEFARKSPPPERDI